MHPFPATRLLTVPWHPGSSGHRRTSRPVGTERGVAATHILPAVSRASGSHPPIKGVHRMTNRSSTDRSARPVPAAV